MKPFKRIQGIVGTLLVFGIGGIAAAQQPSYGPSVNLATAKRIAAAAEAEIRKNGWQMAIAVVDTHGFLVYFQLGDDTQSASGNIAVQKARTAAMWRRPTKVMEEAVAAGRVATLSLPDAVLVEGGVPIVVAGKIIGAVAASGGTSPQDAQAAKAGLEALK
jgi:uncharacterized protein GlcG (DUF336 family)